MTEAELRTHLEGILRTKLAGIEPEVVDGKRVLIARFKSGELRANLLVRFKGDVVPQAERIERVTALRAKLTEGALAPGLDKAIARAKGEDEGPKTVLIQGTASSTSVDWYGTEMSLRALQGMADQFRAGVDVTPRHHGWFTPLEWNDVMGRTVMASIERAEVASPSVTTDSGFSLAITGECYEEDAMTAELTKRLSRGQPIGLSIGGWFTEVRYLYDDDGNLERIIIECVELDHVAVVRSPANPDCLDLAVMRSVAAVALRSRSVPHAETAPSTDRAKDHSKDGCTGEDCPDECACSCHGDRSASVPTPAAPPAVAASGDEARNRPPVADPSLLDAPDGTRKSDTEAGADAAATTPEAPMDPKLLEEIIQRALAGAMVPVTERLTALEARAVPTPTPTPTPEASRAAPPAAESAEVIELRRKLQDSERAREAAEAAAAASADMPVRMGRGAPLLSGTGEFARTELGQLIERAKAGADGRTKTPLLAAVANRAIGSLTVEVRTSTLLSRGEAGMKLRQTCEDAPDLLRSLCMAAEKDGLIGNIDVGWN